MNDKEYRDAQQLIYANLRHSLAGATTDTERLQAYRLATAQLVQAFRDWDGGDPDEISVE